VLAPKLLICVRDAAVVAEARARRPDKQLESFMIATMVTAEGVNVLVPTRTHLLLYPRTCGLESADLVAPHVSIPRLSGSLPQVPFWPTMAADHASDERESKMVVLPRRCVAWSVLVQNRGTPSPVIKFPFCLNS
jgi:hypothetical protein